MVNLWTDKEGSTGLDLRGELTQEKSNCGSNGRNCTTVEGVFNH